MAEKKIPFPLLILAALYGLVGVLMLLGGAILLFSGQTLYSMYSFAIGIVNFYVGYGLYRLNKTAWIVAVLLELVGIASGIAKIAFGVTTISTLLSPLIDFVVLIVLLYYSDLYGVSLPFGKSKQASPTSASVFDANSMKFFRKLD